MTSGYIPPEGEPGPDAVLDALKEMTADNSGLREFPPEELSRLLHQKGYLREEPSPVLVAEMLQAMEAEEARGEE